MEIFKIVGVGILTCIIAIILKQIKPEFLIIVILSGGIIIFLNELNIQGEENKKRHLNVFYLSKTTLTVFNMPYL